MSTFTERPVIVRNASEPKIHLFFGERLPKTSL